MGINFRGLFPSFHKPAMPATAYQDGERKRPPLALDKDADQLKKMSGGSKNCDTSGTNADNEGA